MEGPDGAFNRTKFRVMPVAYLVPVGRTMDWVGESVPSCVTLHD